MLPLFLTRLLIRTGLARLLPRVRRLGGGTAAYLHYYSDRVLATPLADLTEAASILEARGPDGIDLAQGSPRFDLVPSSTTWLPIDRRGLPPPGGLPELRQAVADHLAAEQGLTVRPADEVLITAGAAGALAAALDSFVNPGDRVVLFDPTSLLYPLLLRPRRARVRWVPTETEGGRIRFHFDDLARALHRARLLILASPASPTGGVFAADDLEQIAWWADRHDVLLLWDRAFARFQYDGEPSELGTLPKARRRTLTLGSVSKGHGLASARVGWLAGDRRLVGACSVTAALHGQLVPTVCQQLACAALGQDRQTFTPLLTELGSRRRYAFDRLRAMGLKPTWPAGGLFLWVGVGHVGLDGAALANRLLCESNVLVWPGHFFGPGSTNHVRVSYVADEGRVRAGLARMVEVIRQKDGAAQQGQGTPASKPYSFTSRSVRLIRRWVTFAARSRPPSPSVR
jgi:aspartate/methionine/tyrosine aminotransferase